LVLNDYFSGVATDISPSAKEALAYFGYIQS
jgi:hypothetical protein